jgi:hypothetical protein
MRQTRPVTETIAPHRRSIVGWPFASCVVLYFAVLVALSFALPGRVPLHWNGAGSPDSFGSPAQFATGFAVPGIVLFALFFGIMVLLRRGSLVIFNVPYPWYWKTPAHEARLRIMLRSDLNYLFCAVYLFLTVLVIGTVASALDRTHQLSWLIPVALVVFLVFVVGYVAYMFAHRYRPPASS